MVRPDVLDHFGPIDVIDQTNPTLVVFGIFDGDGFVQARPQGFELRRIVVNVHVALQLLLGITFRFAERTGIRGFLRVVNCFVLREKLLHFEHVAKSALAKSILLIVVSLSVRFPFVSGNDDVTLGTSVFSCGPMKSLMQTHRRNIDVFLAYFARFEQPTRFVGVHFFAMFNELLQIFEIYCWSYAFIAAEQFFGVVRIDVFIVGGFVFEVTLAKSAILQQLVATEFRVGLEVFQGSIPCRALFAQKYIEGSLRASHIGFSEFELFLDGRHSSSDRGLLLIILH